MAAIEFGTDGLTWGLSAEAGGLIQDLEIRDVREKASVRDAAGATKAKCYYDPRTEVSFNFYPTGGGSGLNAITCAASFSLTNYTPAAGLIIAEEVTHSRTNTEYWKTSVKAEICPDITS